MAVSVLLFMVSSFVRSSVVALQGWASHRELGSWSVTRIRSRSAWVANRGVRGVDFVCLGWHLLDLHVRDHDELAAGAARPAAVGK
jgi:hypothetical protein